MTNVMDENHAENHQYKTRAVQRELDDVVWYLEDDQVAQELVQAKERLKT